jgi:hypothetical protein
MSNLFGVVRALAWHPRDTAQPRLDCFDRDGATTRVQSHLSHQMTVAAMAIVAMKFLMLLS